MRTPTPDATHHRSYARKRGFALLIAIIMIALVGTASVSLMILLRDQASRTTPAADEAQLRQLLIAGGMMATQLLPSPTDAGSPSPSQTRELALPPALIERGGSVNLRSERGAGGVSWLIHVEARLEKRSLAQTIHFARTDRGWSAAEARLNRALTPDEPPGSAPADPTGR